MSHGIMERARAAWNQNRAAGTATDPPYEFIQAFIVNERITELERRVARLEAGSPIRRKNEYYPEATDGPGWPE